MVQIIKLKKHTGRSSIYNRKGSLFRGQVCAGIRDHHEKYPNAILTLNSAFYYYGLTDTIPDHYYVATPKSNRKIEDVRVKQIYENSNAFEMGKTTIEYDGVDITIYNEERLLIELIRNKRKFSFDLYKEIISNYRKLIHKMDMTQIMEYAYELPKTNMVMETIRLEIL